MLKYRLWAIALTRDQLESAAMNINVPFLKRLRLLSIVEGTSTLILFGIAMPLKYLADMPLAVRIVGSLHGFLFVCLVIAFLMAIQRVPISKRLAAIGIIAAVLPFGPFIVDHWLNKMRREAELAESA